MNKIYEVSTLCNALIDMVYTVSDTVLDAHKLRKGATHLITYEQQQLLIKDLGQKREALELGGSSLNMIRALSLLGKKTFFAGMIARDEFGQMVENRLNLINIAHSLNYSEQEGTGTCLVLVSPDGERTMVTYLGVSSLFDKTHIPSRSIANSKIFHFSGYQWDTEGQKEAILKSIQIAKENHCLVSFDIADPFVVERNIEDFKNLIKKSVDIVFANEQEAFELYQSSAEACLDLTGADITVIKQGAKGACIKKKGSSNTVFVKPVPTKVVDTTAAGDMFAAGFLYGFSSSLPLEVCGEYGATLASDVISGFGASLSQSVIDRIKR